MRPRHFKRIDPNTLALIKQILIGVVVFAGVGLLLTAVWHGTRVAALTIAEVEVSGGETISHQAVQDLVWQTLEGNRLGLIPRTFAWSYPRADIHESVATIERIHNISIDRVSGKKLTVTFDEYIPRALWCDKADERTCAFVDVTGYAYTPAPDLSGGSLLRFARMGEEVALQTNLLPPEEFEELLVLVDLLAVDGWYISQVDIDSVGDAFLQIVDGGELKVTRLQSPEEIVDNLRTIVSAKEFAHLAPGNFQYIDLRFGNKVFVNEEFPEEEIVEEEKTASTSATVIDEEVGDTSE